MLFVRIMGDCAEIYELCDRMRFLIASSYCQYQRPCVLVVDPRAGAQQLFLFYCTVIIYKQRARRLCAVQTGRAHSQH